MGWEKAEENNQMVSKNTNENVQNTEKDIKEEIQDELKREIQEAEKKFEKIKETNWVKWMPNWMKEIWFVDIDLKISEDSFSFKK